MFQTARIKLTAWYLLIIMTVSASFSAVIFKGITNEVERFARSQRFRIERQIREGIVLPPDTHLPNKLLPPISDPELVEDTKNRLLFILAIINAAIFVLAGVLGYILAGVTLKPIKEMLEEQNQFITDASHELRTPLTSLKSAMEVTLRDKKLSLSGAKKVLLDNIQDVNKLQQLSDELLLMAQYQKPINGSSQSLSVSLPDIAQKAIRTVSRQAKQKKISISFSGDQINGVGTANELENLMTILLDNAVKYSNHNSSVFFEINAQANDAVIRIRDHGIGISHEDLPHIFDRFYRSDAARTKTGAGGFGLGLSIAKKIVERYHGSIDVTSQPGKGSEFIVRIPAAEYQ